MKYLVIECNELGDQWECDANRNPICMTDNYEDYDDYGYEIYELCSDNTFKLIKGYEDCSEQGMAIYQWNNANEETDEPDIIYEKYENKDRNYFTKKIIKKLITKYHFEDTVDEIYDEIRSTGSHGEEIEGKWIVIGEYNGSRYDIGY